MIGFGLRRVESATGAVAVGRGSPPAALHPEAGAIPHRESFAARCGREPVIDADELERRRPSSGGEEGGGELKGIGSAKK